MNNKNIITIIVLCTVLILGAVIFSKKTEPLGGPLEDTIVSGGIINTSSTVTTKWRANLSPILATSTDRIDATLCQLTTSTVSYLHFTNSTTSITTEEGYRLVSGTCKRLTEILGYRYSGPVYGISTSTTSTLSIICTGCEL